MSFTAKTRHADMPRACRWIRIAASSSLVLDDLPKMDETIEPASDCRAEATWVGLALVLGLGLALGTGLG